MYVQIQLLCSECDAPAEKIIGIFTRERFCGAYCYEEWRLKFRRMLIRTTAEEIEHGVVI